TSATTECASAFALCWILGWPQRQPPRPTGPPLWWSRVGCLYLREDPQAPHSPAANPPRASKLLIGCRHSSGHYQPQSGQRIISDLWPQQHGQSQTLRVFSGRPNGDCRGTAVAAREPLESSDPLPGALI